MKRQLFFGAIALSLSCEAQDPEYTTELQPIVGGELVEPGGFPAVGMLFFGGSLCTGTLIDPEWVLTAAHCVVGQSAGATTFNIGNGFGQFTESLQASELHFSRDYNANAFFLGSDIALVKLAEPFTAIPPIPFNREPLEGLLDLNVAGCDTTKNCFTAVGFGDTDGGAGDAGTKRIVEIEITGLSDNDEHILFGNSVANTCQGDSGGPAFMTLNGELRVIGVTSGGQTGCRGPSFDQRTDTETDPFLDPVMNGEITAEPDHCVADGFKECDLCGISDPDCACIEDGFCQGAAACPAEIERDPDCPVLTEVCDNGLDEDGNGLVDDGCEGCTVAHPGSGNTSLLFLAGLFSLSLVVLSRRRK